MKIIHTVCNYLLIVAVLAVFSGGLTVCAQDRTTEKEVSAINESDRHQNEKIIVYYFHGKMRCRTCRTIEALTRQAVEEGFSGKIKDGSMELKTINVDISENSHFVTDYQLITRSVVVSNQRNGKENNWKRLDRVWELVKNDSAFINYIKAEINSVMKGES